MQSISWHEAVAAVDAGQGHIERGARPFAFSYVLGITRLKVQYELGGEANSREFLEVCRRANDYEESQGASRSWWTYEVQRPTEEAIAEATAEAEAEEESILSDPHQEVRRPAPQTVVNMDDPDAVAKVAAGLETEPEVSWDPATEVELPKFHFTSGSADPLPEVDGQRRYTIEDPEQVEERVSVRVGQHAMGAFLDERHLWGPTPLASGEWKLLQVLLTLRITQLSRAAELLEGQLQVGIGPTFTVEELESTMGELLSLNVLRSKVTKHAKATSPDPGGVSDMSDAQLKAARHMHFETTTHREVMAHPEPDEAFDLGDIPEAG